MDDSTNTLLVTIPYQTRDDIDVFFENSNTIYNYIEGDDIEQPVALALVSKGQFDKLTRLNYQVAVIEENPDVSSWLFLTTRGDAQSADLSSFSDVHYVTNHHVLVKLTASQQESPDLPSLFEAMPLTAISQPPLYRTATITRVPTKEPIITQPPAESSVVFKIGILTSLFLFIAAGIYLFLVRRKRHENML